MFHGVLNLCQALALESQLQSPAPSQPTLLRKPAEITSSVTLIDLSSLSLTQLWSLRSHLQQASILANANYPETLDSILILNSPSFFPTVWGWINGWFDKGTQAKIRILSDPIKDAKTRETLRMYLNEEDLPKVYGGKLDWSPGDKPLLDEQGKSWLKDVLGVEKWEGPVWVDPSRRRGDAGSKATSAEMKDEDSGVGLEATVPVDGETSKEVEATSSPQVVS